MQTIKKTVVFLLILSLVNTLCSCSKKVSTDEKLYDTYIDEVYMSNLHMPKLSELDNYNHISIIRKTKNVLIMPSVVESIVLICRYDQESYLEQKETISSTICFLDDSENQPSELKDYTACVSGFDIRIVEKQEKITEGYWYDYPKCFLMIGTNDSKHSIAYLFHFDSELDEIDNLDRYINKYYSFE